MNQAETYELAPSRATIERRLQLECEQIAILSGLLDRAIGRRDFLMLMLTDNEGAQRPVAVR